MKLLMVTSRNIDKNGGENALIMGRHMAMYSQYGIETDIVFFHKDTDSKEESIYKGIKYLDAKKETLFLTIEKLLISGEYQGLVISGFYDYKFTGFIRSLKRNMNFIIITDIHATIREIYEYCIPDLYHIIGTRYLYIKKKKRFKELLRISDFAFVVSDEEIKEINSFLPNNNINFIRVRCGCYQKMYAEKYFHMRVNERIKLGFADDEIVFVYSGSKDRWQKFDETVELFERIKDLEIKSKFAFYMNLNEKSKEEVISKLGKENVIFRWVTPEMMKRELTAYDIGVMLRDNAWTNRVAFPNKFSDYLSSGLHLCMSEAVVDPSKLLKKYNIQTFDCSNLSESIDKIAEERKHRLHSYIFECEKMVDEELLYEKQVKENCKCLVNKLSEMLKRE